MFPSHQSKHAAERRARPCVLHAWALFPGRRIRTLLGDNPASPLPPCPCGRAPALFRGSRPAARSSAAASAASPDKAGGSITWHSPAARVFVWGLTADTWPPLRRGGTNSLNGFSLSMASEKRVGLSELALHDGSASHSEPAGRWGRTKGREAKARGEGGRARARGGAPTLSAAPSRRAAAPQGPPSAAPRPRAAGQPAAGPACATSPAPPRERGWGCAAPSGARWGGRSAGGPRGGGSWSTCRGCPAAAPAALPRAACSSAAGDLWERGGRGRLAGRGRGCRRGGAVPAASDSLSEHA